MRGLLMTVSDLKSSFDFTAFEEVGAQYTHADNFTVIKTQRESLVT